MNVGALGSLIRGIDVPAGGFPILKNIYYMTTSTAFRALRPSVSARNVPFEVSDQSVLARRNDLMFEVIVPLAPYSRRPADRVDFVNHDDSVR